jgi:hypothetical protein
MKPETRQDIARRLVAEAEGLVVRQRQLVAELEKNGHESGQSQKLLGHFEDSLESFRRTLALLQIRRL